MTKSLKSRKNEEKQGSKTREKFDKCIPFQKFKNFYFNFLLKHVPMAIYILDIALGGRFMMPIFQTSKVDIKRFNDLLVVKQE